MGTNIAYTQDDAEVFAKTLWAEARGEPREGQLATAWVIRNRSQAAAFAGDLAGKEGAVSRVCLKPYQFSCWLESDPNYELLQRLSQNDYAVQLDLALAVLDGEEADPTRGADHYHTVASPPGAYPWPPSWAMRMRACGIFGSQIFYDADMPRDGALARGSKGDAVKALQRALVGEGFYLGPNPVDGDFGQLTQKSVSTFQRDRGLLPATGIADAATLAALGVH